MLTDKPTGRILASSMAGFGALRRGWFWGFFRTFGENRYGPRLSGDDVDDHSVIARSARLACRSSIVYILIIPRECRHAATERDALAQFVPETATSLHAVQHTLPQQLKAGSPVHLPFDQLEAINLALRRAIAPFQCEARFHRCPI